MMKSIALLALVTSVVACNMPQPTLAEVITQKNHKPIQPMNITLSKTKWQLPSGHKTSYAMYGLGCFWGAEVAFRKQAGVVATSVGYSGGATKNPTYEQVCTHKTGHAEVVLIEFDPSAVTFEQLTEKFFSYHNPTTLNRQGPDFGSNYRSAIFYFDEEQLKVANQVKSRIEKSGKWKDPIVTQIAPAPEYFPAEDYHQRYGEKNPNYYCPIGG